MPPTSIQLAADPRYTWYSLALAASVLERYRSVLGLERGVAVAALARAAAASPGWPPGPSRLLVARGDRHPTLALWGPPEPEFEAWLAAQRAHLDAACRRLRYVGWGEAEVACGELAARLRQRLSSAELARARFAAIPRGGFVVLGLLACALGLRREQMEAPAGEDDLVVVVDDCALTGARLTQWLDRCPARRVVAAPLLSPPALRAAVEAGEERVLACLSAGDLEVVARSSPWPGEGDGLRRYWVGDVQPLAFPWNEPDRSVWNPVAERWERAWRLVPPELCLKNRPPPGSDPIPVQVMPEGPGPLYAAPGVLSARLEDRVLVAHLERGESFALEGTAAALWQGLLEHGDVEPAAAVLERLYEAPADALRADARAFAEDLLGRGLLERRGR